MSLRRRAGILLSATALTLGGCVLLLPAELGPACAFDGSETTACGKCIASSCRGVVNDCCGDSVCQYVLGSLDRCGRSADCAPLASSATSTRATSMATCIKTACSDVCSFDGTAPTGKDGGTSGAKVTCTTAADGFSCSCAASAGSPSENTGSCARGALSSFAIRCCASYLWPGAGGSCTCAAMLCDPRVNVGCSCSFGKKADIFDTQGSGCARGQDVPPDLYWDCCISSDGSRCYCGRDSSRSTVCRGGFAHMSGDCTAADMPCPEGTTSVTYCQ